MELYITLPELLFASSLILSDSGSPLQKSYIINVNMNHNVTGYNAPPHRYTSPPTLSRERLFHIEKY